MSNLEKEWERVGLGLDAMSPKLARKKEESIMDWMLRLREEKHLTLREFKLMLEIRKEKGDKDAEPDKRDEVPEE